MNDRSFDLRFAICDLGKAREKLWLKRQAGILKSEPLLIRVERHLSPNRKSQI